MLKIYWRIGKKPRGNWLTPLDFRITIEHSDDLKLAPYFRFSKDYDLPGEIILANVGSPDLRKDSSAYCRRIKVLSYHFDSYKDSTLTLATRSSLSRSACDEACRNCKAFLPWRPGVPEYSDYEEVFYQLAADINNAWLAAVTEAAASSEYSKDPVVITSADYLTMKETAELANKPARRVKV